MTSLELRGVGGGSERGSPTCARVHLVVAGDGCGIITRHGHRECYWTNTGRPTAI